MDAAITRICLTTIPYEGNTRAFLLRHGCRLEYVSGETLIVTLPVGAIREEVQHTHEGAVVIYGILLPDGVSFKEWHSVKRNRSLIMDIVSKEGTCETTHTLPIEFINQK